MVVASVLVALVGVYSLSKLDGGLWKGSLLLAVAVVLFLIADTVLTQGLAGRCPDARRVSLGASGLKSGFYPTARYIGEPGSFVLHTVLARLPLVKTSEPNTIPWDQITLVASTTAQGRVRVAFKAGLMGGARPLLRHNSPEVVLGIPAAVGVWSMARDGGATVWVEQKLAESAPTGVSGASFSRSSRLWGTDYVRLGS